MTARLFTLAQEQGLSLSERFDGLTEGSCAATASGLCAQVCADGRCSVNMKPGALEAFLHTGIRMNAWEYAARQAESSGRSMASHLKEDLGPY